MSDRPLNATAASLLGFLADGPASGWDLLRTAQLVIGRFWSITSSQVYRELASMEGEGFIVRGDTGPRDRRPYALTPAGQQAFTTWVRRSPGDEQIRYPLLLTVSFGRHLPPGLLAEFVSEHRVSHAERLSAYLDDRQTLGDDNPYSAATLDFGIRYEQAVLDWIDALPAAITAP
jgi:DNA-binding PadR family transcriptional regulator